MVKPRKYDNIVWFIIAVIGALLMCRNIAYRIAIILLLIVMCVAIKYKNKYNFLNTLLYIFDIKLLYERIVFRKK